MRSNFALACLLALGGCAAVTTFASETGSLTSGRTQQAVTDAQSQQNQAVAQHASLEDQLASLRAQQAQLRTDLALAQGRLRTVKKELARSHHATQVQREQYQALLLKQRELQKRLADASKAPPTDREDAADAKEDMDRLTAEKAALQDQIGKLQSSL